MSEQGLPATWTWAHVGDVVRKIEAGRSFRCDERPPTNGEVGVAKVSAVSWGSYDERESKTCTRNEMHDDDLLIRPGDFLFSRANTIDLVGACVIVGHVTQQVMLSDKILRFHVDPMESARWLLWYLRSRVGRAEIERLATGNQHSMRNIGQDRIRQIRLPFAPLSEQQRIAGSIDSYLSRLYEAAAILERVQRNLKRYRASVLKAAVEGRLVPTEAELARAEKRDYEPASVLLERILTERRRLWEEAELAKLKAAGKPPKDDRWKAKYQPPAVPDTADLPPLPEGWCWTSLDQLICGPLANGRSVPDAHTGGFPVLRLTSMRGTNVDLAERKLGAWTAADAAPFLVRRGDFFVVRGNGSRHLVGRGCLVDEEPDPVAYPDTLIRARLTPAIHPALFALLWHGEVVRSYIESTARTTAGIYKVNQADLARAPIPLAPVAEQHRLHRELDRLMSVADAITTDVDRERLRCERLRHGILRWAFEAKLVDPDPNDEPAEVLLARIRAERESTRPPAEAAPQARPKRRAVKTA